MIDFSDFSTVDHKAYFSPLIDESRKDSITRLVDNALKRNELLWGGPESRYQIIFCDSNDELKRYSKGANSLTICSTIGNYVVIGKDFINLDIISHELCHSFLYNKVGYTRMTRLPAWFDEGVAMQLDYRDYYCDSLMEKNYITDPLLLKEISLKKTFYYANKEKQRYNYTIAKYEVQNWIRKNGKARFNELIESLKEGKEFNEVYN